MPRPNTGASRNAFVSSEPSLTHGKVLVYTSSADRIPRRDGGTSKTGTWLPELTHPLAPLEKAQCELDFATPDGRPCIIDPRSRALIHWGLSRRSRVRALALVERLNDRGFDRPLKLSSVLADASLLDSYDALFIPGGHAPMTDVLHKDWTAGDELNAETGTLLQHFHRAGKPTALICHGPAALAAAPYVDGKWIYDGYRMTCVSLLTDRLADLWIGARPPDYVKRILERRGGIVETVLLGRSFVVEDRELIVAQDPFGARELGERLLNKLSAYVRAKTAAPLQA